MISILQAYSLIPNFRGKNFLGQKIIKLTQAKLPRFVKQKMQTGFHLQLNLRDRMQSVMFVKRCHEPETEHVFKDLVKGCKVFFDVGANIGYFSFLVKQLAPQSHVYSFEPLPKNIEAYKENQKLNAFKEMHLQQVCVADVPGKTEFLLPPEEESGWGRMAHREMFSGKKIERTVITLDEFIQQNNIQTVDFMKIDVEGYEFKVLKGAEKLLSQFRPKICIELNEPCLLDTGTSGEEIFTFLKERNYKMFALKRGGELFPVSEPPAYYKYLNYFALPQ